MGFEEDEALLPYPKRSFEGYRLLQEYFTFSEKFLFFELNGLEAIAEAGCKEQVEILFCFSRFDRPERQQDLEVGVTARTLRLGCTPIVNLFSHTAEPILVTHTKHEYELIADVRHQETTEVFSIDDVMGGEYQPPREYRTCSFCIRIGLKTARPLTALTGTLYAG